MKKQAEEWLKFANADLLTIKQIIDNKDLTQMAAFHGQQCVEKSFKAIIELFDQKVPRIHDLRKLYHAVKELNLKIDIDIDILDQLNQVYIDTRYPADFGILPDGIPSVKKAEEFLLLAEDVFSQIKEIIGSA